MVKNNERKGFVRSVLEELDGERPGAFYDTHSVQRAVRNKGVITTLRYLTWVRGGQE